MKFSQILNRFDIKLTPLAAYGLVIMAVIMTVLGLERFMVAGQALEERVVKEQANLALLLQIQQTDVWQERLEFSLKAREQAKANIWTGKTAGVIAAEFQQVLRKAALSKKGDKLNIRVDPAVVQVDDIDVLAFDFTGLIPAGDGIFEMFSELAAQPRLIVVKDVRFAHFIRDRRATRLMFSGFLPIELPPDAQTPPEP